MPRPPTKRKAKSTSKQSTKENAPRSPEPQGELPASVPQVEIPLQQPKDQTPVTKSHEQAIESSPMGERAGTGSRPATRSRGYSSTLSLGGRKGDTSSKIPGTPAFENSVLSNFRRRPRQPSILQMMQAEDRSSDLDDDDFLGGLSPDDESTPLNVSRGKSLLVQNESPATPSQAPEPSSGSSRKRKRSSANIEIQVPQSPLAVVGDSPVGTPTPEGEGEVEVHERGSPADMPPPPPPRRPRSPDVSSQIMASPMSSIQGTPRSTIIPGIPNSLRIPAGSEEQASSNPAVSTASLQDRLLPRRRQRQRRRRNVNTFDVPSDSSESDEASVGSDQDELSYIPTLKSSRSQRNRTTKTKSSHTGQKKQVKQKAASKTKTYSARNAGNDKENEPADGSSPLSSAPDTDELESDPSSPPDKYLSEELRLQAKKFAEVDQWQMEFEDVPASQDSTYR